jgi:hypothetical protein
MLYYYLKEYPATQRNAIIFAQTARYEIVYRIRAKGTQVFVNEDFVGTIDGTGVFFRESERLILGTIDRSDASRISIKVGERQVGTFLIPMEKSVIRTRAFDMDEKLDEQAHLLFMIQGIHEVVLYLNR